MALHPEATTDDAPHVEAPRAHVLPLWRDMLGGELRRLRHERGETLDETAETAGVSPQYLSEMERGRKDPSSEMIDAVAGALGVTLVDLVRSVGDNLQAVQPSVSHQVTCQASFMLAA